MHRHGLQPRPVVVVQVGEPIRIGGLHRPVPKRDLFVEETRKRGRGVQAQVAAGVFARETAAGKNARGAQRACGARTSNVRETPVVLSRNSASTPRALPASCSTRRTRAPATSVAPKATASC